MARVLRCDEGDINALGECAAPYWAQDTGLLPELSTADAHAIAVAIAGLWALAFVIRAMRKFLETKVGL